MKINLLILQENTVKDDYFLKNLADNLVNRKNKFLILHEPLQNNKVETWFYTKRISAKLSESMVANVPFSAEHKSLFRFINDEFHANQELFHKNFQMLNTIVINGVFNNQIIDINILIDSIKKIMEIDNMILFTLNPLSPLAAINPIKLETKEELEKYKKIYPEEQKTLDIAGSFLPIFISNPQSFIKIF